MKQERDARSKEKEADQWLQMKSFKRSAAIMVNEIPNKPPAEELNNADNEVSKSKVKPNLEPVTVQSGSIPIPIIASRPSTNNVASSETDHEQSKNFTSGSSVEDMKGDANVLTTKLTESLKDMPLAPVVSSPKSFSENMESPVKNYTGDIHSPQPVDCTEDTIFSESQAFDVSSILRIAAHREEAQSHLKSERGHPNRCSTMKVEPAHLAMVEPLPELNMTPIKNDSEDDEEVLSEFAKAIKNKGKLMKRPDQKQRLNAIDIKTRPLHEDLKAKASDVKSATKHNEKHPAKPPRSHHKIGKTESPYSNNVDSHKTPTGLKTVKEVSC